MVQVPLLLWRQARARRDTARAQLAARVAQAVLVALIYVSYSRSMHGGMIVMPAMTAALQLIGRSAVPPC